MTSREYSIEQRLTVLERWRQEQIVRDTFSVTEIGADITVIKGQLGDVHQSMGDLEGRSVATRFFTLGIDIKNLVETQMFFADRMVKIEAQGNEVQSQVTALIAGQRAMGIQVAAMYTSQRITATQVTGMDIRLRRVEGDVGTIKEDVVALKENVGTLSAKVGTLSANVGTLNAKVDRILSILQERR